MLAGIEAGGTKFVCAVAKNPQKILDEIRIPTTCPTETIAKAIAFFLEMQKIHEPISSLGIGSFGPIDPDPDSSRYGRITSTPKPNWANTDIVKALTQAIPVPVGFDTDVNGAALGEYLWGAGKGANVVLYLTVGTGVGGGVVIHGKPVHGMIHPEMGHIFVKREYSDIVFKGSCPFHGDCLEGLVSGPAIEARMGKPVQEIDSNDPCWDYTARYLAQALCNYMYMFSPNKIILGGGVLSQPTLMPKIHSLIPQMLNGYVESEQLKTMDAYIVEPGLGTHAGVIGALALGMKAAGKLNI